ncbi:MAG: hypothetical protein V1926_00075 [Candidatus Peregrinibacteria bacterium]
MPKNCWSRGTGGGLDYIYEYCIMLLLFPPHAMSIDAKQEEGFLYPGEPTGFGQDGEPTADGAKTTVGFDRTENSYYVRETRERPVNDEEAASVSGPQWGEISQFRTEGKSEGRRISQEGGKEVWVCFDPQQRGYVVRDESHKLVSRADAQRAAGTKFDVKSVRARLLEANPRSVGEVLSGAMKTVKRSLGGVFGGGSTEK